MGLRKRILALALALALTLTVLLPVTAAAETSKEQEMMDMIARFYRRTLAARGVSTLGGFCGVVAGYQLYYLGVETWPNPQDGRVMFDYYKNKDVTTGGYSIKAYPASQYTLEETLNLISHGGTRDVYNILVGFEWSSTEAGAKYGHTVVIHAIMDGYVYSVESFYTSVAKGEGRPIRCSIAEFAALYDDWTRLDGVIWFGNKEYVDQCEEYGADLFVRANENTPLLAEPGTADGTRPELLRQVRAGERLRVSGLYKNTRGAYYYRVEENGRAGYIAAGAVEQVRVNTENVTVRELRVPETVVKGNYFTLGGRIVAEDSLLTGARVEVTDAKGAQVLGYTVEQEGRLIRLNTKQLNSAMAFGTLEEGTYTYRIYADVANSCYTSLYGTEEAVSIIDTVLLWDSEFQVVGAAEEVPEPTQGEEAGKQQEFADGWNWDGDTWYYCQDGAPRVGWFCDGGINYYFHEDGSAAMGWVTVNGQARYFTATGAMRTGWLDTEEGRYYLLRNGVAARGWRTVDGTRYYFAEDTGILQAGGWVETERGRYYLLGDGQAATGWVELEEGRFFFGEDGLAQARLVKRNGQTYIEALGEPTEPLRNCASFSVTQP